jgi:hypothetical protein
LPPQSIQLGDQQSKAGGWVGKNFERWPTRDLQPERDFGTGPDRKCCKWPDQLAGKTM